MNGWRRLSILLVFALAFASVVAAPRAAETSKETSCKRVVALGDQHGAYEGFVTMLTQAGLIDDTLHWIADEACLVQTGDLLDRGAESRRLLELVIALQREAPDHVFPLLGNHEVMNVVGDLRYVFVDEFAAYAGDETERDRQWGYEQFVAQSAKQRTEDKSAGETDLHAEFDKEFLPGWFGHRRAFAADGALGKWLLTRPVTVKIGRTVFVHGGLSPADAKLGVKAINDRAKRELEDFVQLREQLVEGGVVGPLVPYGRIFATVADALEVRQKKSEGRIDGRLRSVAKKFLDLRTASIFRGDGPLWNRDLAKLNEDVHFDKLRAVLKGVDADRIVVGHTPQAGGRIGSRFGGRVLLIDTGAGPHYGNHYSALEIEGEVIRALYPGEEPVMLFDGSVRETAGSNAR